MDAPVFGAADDLCDVRWRAAGTQAGETAFGPGQEQGPGCYPEPLTKFVVDCPPKTSPEGRPGYGSETDAGGGAAIVIVKVIVASQHGSLHSSVVSPWATNVTELTPW